jgi:hypothetical protein
MILYCPSKSTEREATTRTDTNNKYVKDGFISDETQGINRAHVLRVLHELLHAFANYQIPYVPIRLISPLVSRHTVPSNVNA